MLKYVGNGESLAGVPARDLLDVEADYLGKDFLLKSKLYVEEKKENQRVEKPRAKETKEVSNG